MCCVLTLPFNANVSISAPLVDPLAANISAQGFMAAGNLGETFPKDSDLKFFNRLKMLNRAGDLGCIV